MEEGNLLPSLRFDVITIFPDMFSAVMHYGVTGRAFQRRSALLNLIDPRAFADNAYRSVDDRPYGGGPGMVMMADPLEKAVVAAKQARLAAGCYGGKVVLMSPRGTMLQDTLVKQLLADGGAILVACRYEGVDQRFTDHVTDMEISVGDYVLSGGELPAMAVIDAVVRQMPGALGDSLSAVEESFVERLLDYPQFTRSRQRGEREVPDVLLSGHHRRIQAWRRQMQLGETWLRRPDMLQKQWLTPEEKNELQNFRKMLKARYRL